MAFLQGNKRKRWFVNAVVFSWHPWRDMKSPDFRRKITLTYDFLAILAENFLNSGIYMSYCCILLHILGDLVKKVVRKWKLSAPE